MKIYEANFFVWNGPLGKYENVYITYTNELAKALAKEVASFGVRGRSRTARVSTSTAALERKIREHGNPAQCRDAVLHRRREPRG